MPREITESLIVILTLSYLVESLTEYFFQDTKFANYQKYIAVALGLIVSFGFNVDLLVDWFGLSSSVPYLGTALTGVLLGRGSNFIHDLWKRLRATPEED